MSDDADRAGDMMEKEDELRRKHYRQPPMEANPTGYCLNCEEPLHKVGQRWCNSECRDDWEEHRE
jgi:hypothetical protein